MKTRKITKTTISNDVIIEQLQNGRCVLARGIDIPYQCAWQLEEPTLTDEQQKALEEYHNIINNISELESGTMICKGKTKQLAIEEYQKELTKNKIKYAHSTKFINF